MRRNRTARPASAGSRPTTAPPCRPAWLGLLLAAGLAACAPDDQNPTSPLPALGDPGRGKLIVAEIACGVCHIIPGVRGARGLVGPSLEEFAYRNLIGGVAPNTPDILARWVRDAPSIAPETAMPPLPLTELEARNVAAFLYTLR